MCYTLFKPQTKALQHTLINNKIMHHFKERAICYTNLMLIIFFCNKIDKIFT